MAAATYSLTGTIVDLLGTNTFRTLEGWVQSSETKTITDVAANQSRIGRWPITFDRDGSWTVDGLPGTGDPAWSPMVAYYQVVIRYRDSARDSSTLTFATNAFALTADSLFAEVESRDPAAVTPEFVESVSAAATRAEAAAAEAEAAADRAEDAAGTSAGEVIDGGTP